eukprot:m.514838 g.514838  ORF g.514838 m.514838 type:complete len:464 (-) comp21915_c0_seq5:399-1790(-)
MQHGFSSGLFRAFGFLSSAVFLALHTDYCFGQVLFQERCPQNSTERDDGRCQCKAGYVCVNVQTSTTSTYGCFQECPSFSLGINRTVVGEGMSYETFDRRCGRCVQKDTASFCNIPQATDTFPENSNCPDDPRIVLSCATSAKLQCCGCSKCCDDGDGDNERRFNSLFVALMIALGGGILVLVIAWSLYFKCTQSSRRQRELWRGGQPDAGPGRDNHGAVSVMWRGRVRRITPQHMGPPGPDTDPTQCMEQPLEVPPLYTNEDRFPPEYPAPKTTDDNTDSDVDIVAESADRESPTPLYELVAVPSLLPNYVAASPVSPVGETVAVGRAPQPMLQPVRGRRSFGSSNTARPPAWRTDNTENRQSVFADALSRLPPPRLPTTMQRAPLLNTVSRARRGALPIEFNRTRRRGSAPPRAILQSNWVGVGGREGTTVSRARRTSMPPTPPAMLPPVRAVGTSPSHES